MKLHESVKSVLLLEARPKRTFRNVPLQAELDGIQRWVRDSGNAIGEGDDGWEWDEKNEILTIYNDDGSESTFTGAEIAASAPADPRLDRLR
jgi:hypothetical protein